jgi:hypothetical protein
MKVRLTGLTLMIERAGSAVSIESFARHVGVNATELDTAGEQKRLLFMNADHDADYFVGLVVTVKDHRAYCELVAAGGAMKLRVSELAEDSRHMDFNFFVIHKKTLNALYQHYHQSCSVGSFVDTCAKQFRAYRLSAADAAVAALPTGHRTAEERRVRSQYLGYLRSETIVRKEALEKLIQTMRRVKSFTYSTATPVVEQEDFKPLQRWINKQVQRFSFDRGGPVPDIALAISSYVQKLGISHGRVEGEDHEGLAQVLRIMDNPDSFGEYEYDSIVTQIRDLDLAEFQNSWMVSELLERARANKHIFEVEMRP